MATNSLVQYKAIISKPVPTCDGNAVLFLFGTECTQIDSSTATETIVKSSDMCINPKGTYVSASYRSYPGKINGNLVFSSTLTHKPQLFPPGSSCPGQGSTEIPFCF